jgi:hypothetical protein
METLYKLTSTGKIQQWKISVTENVITKEFGQLNGKMQKSMETVANGKNIGRSNETTKEEQALAQAKAEWDCKLAKDYFLTIEEAQAQTEKTAKEGGYLPMLAKDYRKHAERHLVFPCAIQPKLDGCFFRTTKIKTECGTKTIEEIVENKLNIKVLSYNEEAEKYEYKKIINWFNNGKSNYKEWLDIIPENEELIKCTVNHKFFTNNGWKKANDLNENKDKLLSTNSNHLRNCLIFGTLLGDSCLSFDKRSFSYSLVFRHSNFNLVKEKVDILNLNGTFQEVISGYGSNMLVFKTVLTKTDFPWNELYDDTYNRKLISAKVLKKYLIPQALSMLIADDGSLSFNNGNIKTPRLNLSLHNFSDEQLEQFIIYFKDIWQCVPSIYIDKRVKSNGKFLTFSTKDTLYILNILKDYKIPSVAYKYYFNDGNNLEKCNEFGKYVNFKKRKSGRRYGMLNKYDLEVEDNHNYIANGILVHNCRAIATKLNDDVQLWFRSGKRITTLPNVNTQLNKIMSNGDIFDGELYIHGKDFNEFTGSIRANRNLNPEITNTIELHLYDVPRINGLTEEIPFVVRYNSLPEISLENIVLVETHIVNSFEEALVWYDRWISEGYEGMMFRNLHAPYEQKRSYSLLKYKDMIDEEFEIIDVCIEDKYTKEIDGELVDTKQYMIIIKTEESIVVDVKMKGTQVGLAELFSNPKSLIGKMATVQYFGKTPDGSLRFPVGKTIRFDL